MLLNADVGEGLTTDLLLFPYLDQANIACGGHAGNRKSMHEAITACIDHNVTIGAHPSYPDLENFGRVSIDISTTELTHSLQHQIQSLDDLCNELGTSLSYIKPHGALYHDVMSQFDLFELLIKIVKDYSSDLALMLGATLPEQSLSKAKKLGIHLIREAFADRQYLSEGQLASRNDDGSVFTEVDKIYLQAADLHSGMVKDQHGHVIRLKAESLCLHGDNPASVQAAQKVAELFRN